MMTNRMILADFKTSSGWANNAFILNDLFGNVSDDNIVSHIERIMDHDGYHGAVCVVFVELYGDLLSIDELRDMQDGKDMEKWKGRVSRYVIVNDDLYAEWLKPDGVAQ